MLGLHKATRCAPRLSRIEAWALRISDPHTCDCRFDNVTDERRTMQEADLQERITTLERRARAFRGCAVAWCSIACICFAYLVDARPSGYDVEPGWPIYAAGAAVTAIFVTLLSWGPWRDVRAWMPRVLLLLRWLVASGAVLALTVAVTARAELFLPFGLFGLMLLLHGISLLALSLVSLGLDRRHEVLRQRAEEVRRDAIVETLLAAIREHRRPWWSRRPR